MNARPPIAEAHAPQATPNRAAAVQDVTVSEELLITGKPLFDSVSRQCSALTTKAYSTSFSLGIRMLHRDLREPIQAIYGFVRFADEIVDTFHYFDKVKLLDRFKRDTHLAIEERISLNPILNSFQWAFWKYDMDLAHVDKFLESMERDLDQTAYDRDGYDDYIVGSAEVVGLMCLSVFVAGDSDQCKPCSPTPAAWARPSRKSTSFGTCRPTGKDSAGPISPAWISTRLMKTPSGPLKKRSTPISSMPSSAS